MMLAAAHFDIHNLLLKVLHVYYYTSEITESFHDQHVNIVIAAE